jgi:hypothetical protein
MSKPLPPQIDIKIVDAAGSPLTPENLTKHQQKEYFAFYNFSRSKEFSAIIEKISGQKLNVQNKDGAVIAGAEVTIEFPSNDPPDLLLHTNGEKIGIEVTDFPPHSSPLNKVTSKIQGAHSTPLFSQTGSNPKEIEHWIKTPDYVNPRFGDVGEDIRALTTHLLEKLPEKDKPGNHILLLAEGRFTNPEDVAVHAAMQLTVLRNLRAVVLVVMNKAIAFYPNEYIGYWLENLQYRQGILSFCELACSMIAAGQADAPHPYSIVQVAGAPVHARNLTNAAFESAAVNARALLHFLGIRVDAENYVFEERTGKPRPNDVFIEQFGGTKITVGELEKELAMVNPLVSTREAAVCLVATDKTVAHVTKTRFPKIECKDMHAICRVTKNLVTQALTRMGAV